MRQCLDQGRWAADAVLGSTGTRGRKHVLGRPGRKDVITMEIGDRLDLASAVPQRQAKVITLMTIISLLKMNGLIDYSR